MILTFYTGWCLGCGQTIPTFIQDIIRKYYLCSKNYIDDLLDKAFSAEVFGKNPEIYYNTINDFHYLAVILVFLELEKAKDIANGNIHPQQYYIDKYNLECYKKYFICLGYNIDGCLGLLGLSPNHIPLLVDSTAKVTCDKICMGGIS